MIPCSGLIEVLSVDRNADEFRSHVTLLLFRRVTKNLAKFHQNMCSRLREVKMCLTKIVN